MLTLTIILAVFLSLIIGLLLTPIRLEIDTENKKYVLKWKGIAQAKLIPKSNDLLIRIQVFFWKKDIWPLQQQEKKEKKQAIKKSPAKKRKVSFKKARRKGVRLLKSFKVKKFRLNLDTDDYITNAYLYPIFFFLNKEHRQLKINYQGHSELLLVVENRLYKILLAIFF